MLFSLCSRPHTPDPKPSPKEVLMSKLKAALIGCGRIGTKKHIEAYADNKKDIELVYCSDLTLEKAKNAAEKYHELTGLKTQAIKGYDTILD